MEFTDMKINLKIQVQEACMLFQLSPKNHAVIQQKERKKERRGEKERK
jgi:hypothetical protein